MSGLIVDFLHGYVPLVVSNLKEGFLDKIIM